MKKFSIQIVLLLAVIGVTLVFYSSNSQLSNLSFLPQAPVFKQLQVNNAVLKIEIADTQTKRSQGLGGRPRLASDGGMLFIFPTADKHPFWMKGMSFPLDFIWIKGEKIVDLLQNISPPAPGEADASLPIYSSKVEADKVLEVNAGTVQRLNIKVGDAVKVQ